MRSDLVALFCFPKSCVFALVCIGLVNDASVPGRLVLVKLGSSCLVRSGRLWFGSLCFTLDWSPVVFLVSLISYSLVWLNLVCAVCCAVSNAVAFLNMLGVAALFGLVCLVCNRGH